MKKILVFAAALIVILAIIAYSYYYYYTLSPSMTASDIQMKASIKPYDTDYYLIELDVERIQDEPARHFIAPIAEGLSNINFISEDGLYTPGTISTSFEAEHILRNQVDEGLGMDLMGFAIPNQQGKYKFKFTMQKIDRLTELKSLNLYYVHVEKKLGKDLSWVKTITLQQ
ncbi:hypothetical protein [Paenibacillus sp. GM2]|uniref:hypothetical protein n=1 Tax=Paenibacillus sp. GM2 TaxID=1622070 RepID=UPI000837B4E4|nr:hypothetical protein [Paenibacillus sp. GM2]